MRSLAKKGLVGGLSTAVLVSVFAWMAADSAPVRADTASALAAASLASERRAEAMAMPEEFELVPPPTRNVAPPPARGVAPPPAKAAAGRTRAAEESAPPRAPRAEQRAVRAAPRCEGDLRLVGSVVNEAQPRLSLAVVRKPAGARVLGFGGRIDDLTLVALSPARAEFRGKTGALCTLPVFDAAPQRVAQAKPAAPPPKPEAKPKEAPKGKAMFGREELAEGVRALGGNDYRISRELFMRAMTNPGGATAGAYFKAASERGEHLGMEVRNVRDHTPLKAMGVQNGDIVRTVNGIAMDTPMNMLSALRSVRGAESITISIIRDGRPHDMRYQID